MSGMTRDEIGIWRITGLLSKLDGRLYDIDEAESFVSNITKRLDIIREPTLKKKVLAQNVWKIPTNALLTKFASMPTNLVVIGDRRLSFAYAKHEIKTYTTGLATGIFKWDELLSFMQDALKRYASIGSKIVIYHHRNGYIGTVHKMDTSNSFFEPIKVSHILPGLELPARWNIGPSQEKINTVIIAGWQIVEAKLIRMFQKETMPLVRQWTRWGWFNEEQKWKCSVCGFVTIYPESHQCQ